MLSSKKYGWAFYKIDTTYYHIPSPAYKLGKLDTNGLLLLKDKLSKYYGINAQLNQVLCINYVHDVYYKLNYYKTAPTKYGHFSDYQIKATYKYLKVPEQKLQPVTIHRDAFFPDKVYNKLKLTKIDTQGLMKVFFQYAYPYPSTVYLKSDGTYLITYGVVIHRPDFSKQIKYFIEN